MLDIAMDRIRLEPDGLLLLSDQGPIGIPCAGSVERMRVLIAQLGACDMTVPEQPGMQALLDLLRTAGIARDRSERAVRRQDRLHTARVMIVGDAGWAGVVARQLSNDGIGAVVRMDRVPTHAELVALAGCGPALVIGAMAPSRLDLQIAVEQACREADASFLGAELLGARAVVGPISRPGVAGCWLCAKQRLLANAHDPWAAQGYARMCLRGSGPEQPPEDYLATLAVGRTVATEAARFLDGRRDHPLDGRVLVLKDGFSAGTLHPFLPMPWCEVCGGAGLAPAGNGVSLQAASAEQLLAALPQWVDPETGVIAGIALRDRATADPELPFVAVAVTGAYTEAGESWAAEPAAGKGLSPLHATIGALGEAVERYSASRYAPDALHCATMRDLDGDVLDPRELCLYSAGQYAVPEFPFRPFDPHAAHQWVRGHWLDDGQPVWVAAAQVFYRFRASFDDFFCQVTTNGLAAGSSVADASERAVLELIERDAVMLAWLCREPGVRLLPDASDDACVRMMRDLARCGAAIELYLLDGAGGIPVVLCLGFGDGRNWPGVTATSSAAPDVRAAVRGALLEHGMTGASLRRMMHDASCTRPATPGEIRRGSFLDHAAYYIPARAGAAGFLRLPADQARPVGEFERPPRPWLQQALRHMRAEDIRVAVVDVTSPDVALGPFQVVRAVANRLQPLHCGFGMERLDNPRLRQRLLGAINPDPHPFC